MGETFVLAHAFPNQAMSLGVDEEVTKVFSRLLNLVQWMISISFREGWVCFTWREKR